MRQVLGEELVDLRLVQRRQEMGRQPADAVDCPALVDDVLAVVAAAAGADRHTGDVDQLIGARPHTKVLPCRRPVRQAAGENRDGVLPEVDLVVLGAFGAAYCKRLAQQQVECLAKGGLLRVDEIVYKAVEQLEAEAAHLVEAELVCFGQHGGGHATGQVNAMMGVLWHGRDDCSFPCGRGPPSASIIRTAAAGAGRARHQVSGDRHGQCRGLLTVDDLAQQFDGAIAHQEEGDMDAGEARVVGGAFRPVVKARHGHVVGDGAPGVVQRPHGAEGRFVVAGADGSYRHARGENLLHGGIAAGQRMPPIRHETGIVREVKDLQSRAIGAQACARIAPEIVGAAGDEGDTPVAVAHEVLHGGVNAAGVVGNDGGALFARGDIDEGVTAGGVLLQVTGTRGGVQRVDGNQAVGVPGANGHKVGIGRKIGPGGAQRIARIRRGSHAAGKQQVAIERAGGEANAAKDGVEIAEGGGGPVELPAGQYADGRAPGNVVQLAIGHGKIIPHLEAA